MMKRFTDLMTIALSLFIIATSGVASQEPEIKPEPSLNLNQTLLVLRTASK